MYQGGGMQQFDQEAAVWVDSPISPCSLALSSTNMGLYLLAFPLYDVVHDTIQQWHLAAHGLSEFFKNIQFGSDRRFDLV